MKNFRTFVAAAAWCLACAATAGEPDRSGRAVERLPKPSGLPQLTHFNINRMASPIDVYGRMEIDGDAVGRNGLNFPRGNGENSCVFGSGLLWGGHYGVAGDLRVSGADYVSSLQPGRILADGNYDNPEAAHNRIYRVRRDIPPGDRFADITSEQLDAEGSADQIFTQYHTDWNEWPWEAGAPYDDRDHDGQYDPTTDLPGVKGADQTIWFVVNDLSPTRPSGEEILFSALPMSTELQVTVWGYARLDGLGNTSFRRYLLINKSPAVLDSMYVAQFVDPDVGAYNDDLVGCDTLRSIGFAYNGYPTDASYSPLPPPAVGYDFFQGPIVHGLPTDSAIYKGRWIRGRRNLPMTSFGAFTWPSPDAAYGDPTNPKECYNLMKGLTAAGFPWEDPTNGQESRFPFSGDPHTGSGWVDGDWLPPGDRRFMLCSGPFTMQPGDTQEVVMGVIVAGAEEGVEYLSAVDLMKAFDEEAQKAYDEFFAMPEPPPAPLVTATALDGAVLLSWHENQAAVHATEHADNKGFAFQGYNVYQFPSGSASLQEGKRLATFDLVDGVQLIKERVRDPVTGDSMSAPRQYGSDTGIQRYFHISRNPLSNNTPFVNGAKYHFAVTAYNFNPTPPTTAMALESSPRIITVVPASTSPGVRFGAESGNPVPALHAAGHSSGSPSVRITNPTLVAGYDCEIRITAQDSVTLDFEGTPMRFPNPHWELWNVSSGHVVIPACTVFTSSTEDTIIENFLQVGLTAQRTWIPGEEISSTTYTPVENLTWMGSDPSLPVFESGLKVAWDCPSLKGRSTLKPFEVFRDVEIQFDTANGQRAYVFHRTGPFTPTAQYAGYMRQPFRVLDVSDPDHPRQVDFVFLEQEGSQNLDSLWAPAPPPPHLLNGEDFWIVDDTYSSAEKPEYRASTLSSLLSSKPALYWGRFVLEDSASVPYRSGDVLRIEGNGYVTTDDRWSFTTRGMERSYSDALARGDISQINVFPNPYYGVNPQELDRYGRFVTFNHLPPRATIRIFNLAGVMVRRIAKESTSQFERWDLRNQDGLPVGSGLYIAHIELPDLGASKVLKIAIVQEQQILDRY